MYITQFEIDTKNHLVFKDLTSLSAYHGLIESAFSAEQTLGIRKRHLWRLDKQKILLVSEDKPDKDALAKYGKNIQTKNYDKFLNNLDTNVVYAFELVANPMKKIKGKRRNIFNDGKKLKWLHTLSKRNGFLIDSVEMPNTRILSVHKYHLTLHCTKFNGTLQITDLAQFKNAMINGIGHNKAYGMGLLTVIPLVRKK